MILNSGPSEGFSGRVGHLVLALAPAILVVNLMLPAGAVPPKLRYSTYFGGQGSETRMKVGRDGQGNIILAGSSSSKSLPYPRGVITDNAGGFNLLVVKLSPNGELIWWTFFGGSGSDYLHSLAIDKAGNIYVAGESNSTDFPRTTSATGAGGFIVGLDTSGRMRFSYCGGGVRTFDSVTVVGNGDVYAVGVATSAVSGVSPNGWQKSFGGGFSDVVVAQVDERGEFPMFSYLGGGGAEFLGNAAAGPGQSLFIAGTSSSGNFPAGGGATLNQSGGRGFVTRVDLAKRSIVFSVEFPVSVDDPVAVAADRGGLWLAGSTRGVSFRATDNALQAKSGGLQDGFLARVDNNGKVTYATFLGGNGLDGVEALQVDEFGNVFVSGNTGSSDFPLTDDAVARTGSGFLTVVGPNGQLLYSTRFGDWITSLYAGPARDLAIGVQGFTGDLPIVGTPLQRANAGPFDFYLGLLDLTPLLGLARPSLAASQVMNAASFAGGGVAPGEVVTLFPANAGPTTLVGAQLTPEGRLATTLAETRVLFDGVAAPLVYAASGQISAIVPYGVAGKASTAVAVEYRGVSSAALDVPVVVAAPGLFTRGDGSGQLAALTEAGCCNSPGMPSKPGEVVVLYATGEGQTTPAGRDGTLAQCAAPADCPRPVLPVGVTIGGVDAEILYAGAAPGAVAGLMQVNARVPLGVGPGDALPVKLKVGTFESPQQVTLTVR